jgi:hypothetical protein
VGEVFGGRRLWIGGCRGQRCTVDFDVRRAAVLFDGLQSELLRLPSLWCLCVKCGKEGREGDMLRLGTWYGSGGVGWWGLRARIQSGKIDTDKSASFDFQPTSTSSYLPIIVGA